MRVRPVTALQQLPLPKSSLTNVWPPGATRLVVRWSASHFPDEQRSVAARVARILVEILGCGFDSLTPGSRFIEDLLMTDLEPVEVLVALEREFGVSIPAEDGERLNTIADLVRYLHATETSF